jgi:hypothetical protein
MFGSSLPPVVCRRAHVLFMMFGSSLPPVVCGGFMSYLRCSARLYLQLFVGGRFMSYLRCSARLYLQLCVGGLMSYLRCSARLYLQLFVGGLMSYLHCLCLFGHSVVQHILCYVFVLFFLVYPKLPVSRDCPCLIAPSVFCNVYLFTKSNDCIF